MSIRSLKTQISRLETRADPPRRATFRPNAQGVIPDEFDPDRDLLVVRQIVNPKTMQSTTYPCELTWRGKPYPMDSAT